MKHMNNHFGNSRIFGRVKFKMPMNLQLFAEGEEGGAGGGVGGSASGDTGATAGTEGGVNKGGTTTYQSFDDFLKNPKNQAEFDRRVEKALNTSRTKMQADIEAKMAEVRTEAEKMAKMNTEQKAQYEREKQIKDLTDREAAITKRELMATAKEQLVDKGLPITLASVLNYANAEECTASIDAVSKAFQEAVEKTVNERLAGGKPPKKAETKTIYTLDQIKNMSADEINKNWEAVQEAMKASK